MHQADDDVCLAGFLQALSLRVGGLNRIIEAQALDASRGNQVRGVRGDGADVADLHAVHLNDLRRRHVAALDVGTEVRELCQLVAVHAHAILQVIPALVELVVAHCGGLQSHRVQHVEGRLILQNGRLEGRTTDVVTCGNEAGVRVSLALLVDVAGHDGRAGLADLALAVLGLGKVPVEVGDAEDIQAHLVGFGGIGGNVQASKGQGRRHGHGYDGAGTAARQLEHFGFLLVEKLKVERF